MHHHQQKFLFNTIKKLYASKERWLDRYSKQKIESPTKTQEKKRKNERKMKGKKKPSQ
jgi:hypothetical protein